MLKYLPILLFVIISCTGQGQPKAITPNPATSKTGSIASILDHQIWAIYQDTKGHYWFGSNGRGLYQYDGKNLTLFTTKDGLVDNTIRGIQEDHHQNVYIETPDGISKYNGKQFTTLQPISDPSNEWRLEPNDLWFGYNANDLYRYDGTNLFELELPRQDLVKAYGLGAGGVPFEGNNYSPYAVYGVDKDKEGHVWFGTVTAGAFRYDGQSFLWFGEKELSTLPDGRVPGVRSMIQDKNGYFWLSNFHSKYKINPDLPKGYEKVKAVDEVHELLKDRIGYFNSGLVDTEGNLWMTTYGGGVWKYDGVVLSNMEINNETEEVLLICIYQDREGRIWLGSNNNGVYRQGGEGFEAFLPGR